MSRALWLAVGAGVTILVAVKAWDYVSNASPGSVGHRVHASVRRAEASARDFTDRVRAAMAEREAELRDTLGLPQ